MFTQCPECQIAFRVTAKVLQQASGNVRCGSCGHAFNALQFLSEEMPDAAVPDTGDKTDEPVDELAETSRRLLETLDELAGPDDVRIEDTGVEWRVLDDAAAADVSLSPDELEPADERRYDDNTPLPDEFDDEEDYSPPETPMRREEDQQAKSDQFEERQGDLALSEPEDWADILMEVRDPNAESLEVEEELAAIHNELSAIDEALTDEVPQLDEGELATDQGDLADDIEADLIEQIEAGALAELSALDAEDESDSEDIGDDEDTGVFESVLEDDELADESQEGSAPADDEPVEGEEGADATDEPGFDRESTGEFDAQIDEAARALDDDDIADEYDDVHDDDVDDSPHDDDEAWRDEIDEDEPADGEDEAGIDAILDDDEFDDEEFDDEVDDVEDDEEEEQAAVGENIDFAATLVGVENPEDLFDESSGEVETIIMEGDFIRSEVEKERNAAEHSARSQLDDPAKLLDTYALNRGKLRGGRRSYDPPSVVIIGAIVGLSLILVGQFIHSSRQSLATYGFFNATIAPVYRMLGSPITPDWDIRGWQFEATNGSVDDLDTTLTIVSRIANRSDQLLPYPLVHVSLTNRFEDIMGSRILEPGEYLAGAGDPSQPVEPGEDFTAVITVDDPSVDATGFKLNVCYRVQVGTVRCAIEDFKN